MAKGDKTSQWSGGWQKEAGDTAGTYPDASQVEQGVEYGPDGDNYTGTLGTIDTDDLSEFDLMFKEVADPAIFDAFAIVGTYTVAATAQAKNIYALFNPKPDNVDPEAGGYGITQQAMAEATIRAYGVNGVTQPAIGDTLLLKGNTWHVAGWDDQPGQQWLLKLERRSTYQRGGGIRHAGSR